MRCRASFVDAAGAGGAWPQPAESDGNRRNQRARGQSLGAHREFQDIGWLPGVEKTEGTGGDADKATRKITLKGGATVDEELYAYSAENMSYSYRITEVDVKVLPVNNYSSTITVTPAGDGKSTVEWRGRLLSRLHEQ